jgi:hypothetical protein
MILYEIPANSTTIATRITCMAVTQCAAVRGRPYACERRVSWTPNCADTPRSCGPRSGAAISPQAGHALAYHCWIAGRLLDRLDSGGSTGTRHHDVSVPRSQKELHETARVSSASQRCKTLVKPHLLVKRLRGRVAASGLGAWLLSGSIDRRPLIGLWLALPELRRHRWQIVPKNGSSPHCACVF